MSFNFPAPVRSHTGQAADLTADASTPAGKVKRYGSGYQHTGPGGGGHVGSSGAATLGALNTTPRKAGVQAVLDRAGYDGTSTITRAERLDLEMFLDNGNPGNTYARSIIDADRGVTPGTTTGTPLYPGAPDVPTLVAWLQECGLVMGSTPEAGPLPSVRGFVDRFYAALDANGEHLVLGVNAEDWLWENHERRALPEVWAVREDGLHLFDLMEKAVGAWGLAKAEQKGDLDKLRDAALAAYDAFEPAFVPAPEAIAVPLTFGDRGANPRSVIHRGRFVRDAIVQGDPSTAARKGPGLALTLGQPQHFSRFEQHGFDMTAAPLQADEWRYLLGQKPVGGSGAGLGAGGQASG